MTQTPSRPKSDSPEIKEELETFSEAEVTPNPKIKVEKKSLPPLIKSFYDLPIWRKQISVLLLTQFISIGALLGVGVQEIIKTGRKQLVNQSSSELAATKVNYNLKIDQMGFGFRGQSDNAAVIEAALLHANGKILPPEKRIQLQQILQNEIEARKIEYATLVGKDKRIIVNANKNRSAQVFDPNQLVSQVMDNGEQIKTSELVSATELAQESPPILPQLPPENFYLIRYTVTPVKNPSNGQVIAVLVSGDLIDGKQVIPQITLNEFGGGYSGIYKINADGNFKLASSLSENLDNKNQPLTDTSFLQAILTNTQGIVSNRISLNNNNYTLTAQAVLNNQGQPVAALVRGTPETSLAQLLKSSLILQGRVALVTLLINLLLAFWLGKVIADRIEKLQGVTKEFARGNQDIRANIEGQDEIGNLADSFNDMAHNIELKDRILQLNAENAILLQEITSAKVLDSNDLNNAFNNALNKARLLWGFDRMVVYRFQADGGGYISNESRDAQFPAAIKEKIEAACIPLELREAYVKGRVMATEDVFKAGFAPDHLALMSRLSIKANLVVPILSQGQLFGLLIAHDCQQTRQWQERDISFLKEMAIRFEVILDRLSLLQNQIKVATRSEQLKDITLALTSALNKEELFKIAVEKVRRAIASDRVIVYEFDQNWQGTIVAESVLAGYPESLEAQILDPCFAEGYVEKYQQGRVQAIANIYEAGLTPCYLQQLEPFAVKANLVAPILEKGKLRGLLIAHQCSQARYWQAEEIELFSQLSTQLGLALERVNLLGFQQEAEKQQREAKEILQKRALELLMQVDPISQGDLTIRAEVTNDEIGTIADSYNATVESLRQIVGQVQSAALEVTNTTNSNKSDLHLLEGNIQDQRENMALARVKIEAMSKSSAMVAATAQQAQSSLRQAQATVEKGDRTMNLTVKSISQVRYAVQDASSQLQRLGEATAKISNVVGLISRFAAQTHLLALKASIEAARAGEEGKGFAVIADEVRTLASQSAEATADIEDLVTKIQSETKEMITTMAEGTEQVTEGTELLAETRASLKQITEVTRQINQLVEVIASAAYQQRENSQEVREKMGNVATVGEKTSVSVDKLSNSFGQLLATAKQLEVNVSKFKLQ